MDGGSPGVVFKGRKGGQALLCNTAAASGMALRREGGLYTGAPSSVGPSTRLTPGRAVKLAVLPLPLAGTVSRGVISDDSYIILDLLPSCSPSSTLIKYMYVWKAAGERCTMVGRSRLCVLLRTPGGWPYM